uniref:arrestin domain-containing protein 3-like n=1 Tax=Myxine glutinosa TaxID=7769 RepID=UPI00358FC1C8
MPPFASNGRLRLLDIVFDAQTNGSRPLYSDGDLVSGRVVFKASGPLQLRAVRLAAHGAACVRCTGGQQQRYLHFDTCLLGGSEGTPLETLVMGHHELPFCFELPEGILASSFRGRYGDISYYVHVELQCQGRRTCSVQRQFFVVQHVDLSTPVLQSSVAAAGEKTVGIWKMSGPVSLSAKINRGGYCPGELLHIHAEVENCSSRLVIPQTSLCQKQTFLAHGRTLTYTHAVAAVRGESIPSGKREFWDGQPLPIPNVTPSVLDCNIIRVEYFLKVSVNIPGSTKLSVKLPLVLGTIPSQPCSSRTSSFSSQSRIALLQPLWTTLNLALRLQSLLPEPLEEPPSYSEVVTEDQRRLFLHRVELQEDANITCLPCPQEFFLQPPPLYSEVNRNPRTPVSNI